MNSDGQIVIETKIDTSGAEKGVKDLDSTVKKSTKNLKLNKDNVKGLATALGGLTTGMKLGAKAVSQMSEALNTQVRAETLLETSAKNNPYLNAESVQRLKEYASQLQQISTVGDEQLLPLMADLSVSGRTEGEIMQIMEASINASATGVIDLSTAVKSLNASYSGELGRLSRVLPSLKNLTAEELANGEAVKQVAKAYEGMSESATKATGSRQQMQNALGDFKEAIGIITKPTSDLWNKFWKGWFEKGTQAVKDLNDEVDRMIDKSVGKKEQNNLLNQFMKSGGGDLDKFLDSAFLDYNGNDFELWLDQMEAYIVDLGGKANGMQSQLLKYIQKWKSATDEANKSYEKGLEIEQKENELRSEQSKAQSDRDKQAQDFIDQNKKDLDRTIEQLTLEAELRGEEVDRQEVLNAMTSSYIELVTGSDLVTSQNKQAKARLEELKAYAETVPEVTEAVEQATTSQRDWRTEVQELLDKVFPSIDESTDSVIDQIKDKIAELDGFMNSGLADPNDYQDYITQRAKLEEALTEEQKKQAELRKQNRKEELESSLELAEKTISTITELTDSISDAISQSNQDELDAISQQYTDGLLSYEEYNEKKKELNKKEMQEEYKLKLAQWVLNLSQAMVDGASAVLKAYAENSLYGVVVAGLVATQLATITASKPQPPKYKTGGLVGGNDYSDGVSARLSTGEMVITKEQQLQLWKLANGNKNGGMNLNVEIQNNRGSDTSVNAQITARGLRVTVDKMVNTSMSNGNYNQSLSRAENLAQGVSLL